MAEPPAMNADAMLEGAHPSIRWREPINLTVAGGQPKIACRLCIGKHGLKAQEVHSCGYAFDIYAQYVEHMKLEHSR